MAYSAKSNRIKNIVAHAGTIAVISKYAHTLFIAAKSITGFQTYSMDEVTVYRGVDDTGDENCSTENVFEFILVYT